MADDGGGGRQDDNDDDDGDVKFTLEQAMKARGGVKLYVYSFFNFGCRLV